MSEGGGTPPIVEAMRAYAEARATFLEALGVGSSNRDPLAEFSERLVVALVDGELAASRVQRGHDLIDPDGRRVQVRYLANGKDTWVNEHLVALTAEMDAYALVTFEAIAPISVIWFDAATLAAVGARLGKRHPNQDRTLQLTRRNALAVLADPAGYASLGVRVWRAPTWEPVR